MFGNIIHAMKSPPSGIGPARTANVDTNNGCTGGGIHNFEREMAREGKKGLRVEQGINWPLRLRIAVVVNSTASQPLPWSVVPEFVALSMFPFLLPISRPLLCICHLLSICLFFHHQPTQCNKKTPQRSSISNYFELDLALCLALVLVFVSPPLRLRCDLTAPSTIPRDHQDIGAKISTIPSSAPNLPLSKIRCGLEDPDSLGVFSFPLQTSHNRTTLPCAPQYGPSTLWEP